METCEKCRKLHFPNVTCPCVEWEISIPDWYGEEFMQHFSSDDAETVAAEFVEKHDDDPVDSSITVLIRKPGIPESLETYIVHRLSSVSYSASLVPSSDGTRRRTRRSR